MHENWVEEKINYLEKKIEQLFGMYTEAINKNNETNLAIVRLETSLQNFKDSLKESFDEMKDNIKVLMGDKGKKWDTAITAAIVAVVSFVVGYFLK